MMLNVVMGHWDSSITVLDILNRSTKVLGDHQIEDPRLNAELLLAHSLGLDREGLYTHLRRPVEEREQQMYEGLVQRRMSGEPLQYILGHQEFWSIDFRVDPRALIPRCDTESLVEQAVALLSKTSFCEVPRVLEVGTGSGAVAIALAKEVKDIFLVATDISREALKLAEENARSADVIHRIAFVCGDLLAPFCIPRGKEQKAFDLLLSNPPYIVHSDIGRLAREVKHHEPVLALDGGEDGLDFHRRILGEVPSCLREGGWLLLEMGRGQGAKISEMIEAQGSFAKPELVRDLSGIERVVKVQRR